MTGERREGGRSLLTVLFTDIVGSTQQAADVGDGRWRTILDEHDTIVRETLKAHGGREVNTTGDGFVATFTSPTKAIECALAIVEGARQVGVDVRAGIHTGEVERRGRDVVGIGVNIASRIAARAGASEVVVSDTVRDLVTGAGFAFTPRGTQALKGVPGRRRLFAVSDAGEASGSPRAQPRKPSTVRVIVADDHPLWRETLRGLLEHRRAARVVAEAGTGEEAVTAASGVDADVVLMDIDMPGLNGIDATRTIVASNPDAKVLILSSLKERAEVLAAVRAGASGYLLKTARRDEVVDAVLRIQRGELVFPPELSALVLAELRNPGATPAPPPAGLAALTQRERDVLALIAEGASNQAVATQLHVSAKTVEAHIAAIFMKLGLEPSADRHRRVQAAVKFLTASDAVRPG